MDSGKSAAARPHTWPQHWKPAPYQGTVVLKEGPFQTMVGVRVDPGSEDGARIASVTGGLPAALRRGQRYGGPQRPVAGSVRVPGRGPGRGPRLPGRRPHRLAHGRPRRRPGPGGGPLRQPDHLRALRPARPGSAGEGLRPGPAPPRASRPGTALTTEVGNIPVILLKTGEDSFRLFPRASFADFLGRWLLDAMREFASPEVP